MVAQIFNVGALTSRNSQNSVKAGGNNIRLNSQSGGKGRRNVPPSGQAKQKGVAAKPADETQESSFDSNLETEYLSMLELAQPVGELAKNDRIEVKPDWLQFIGEINAGELFSLFELISIATKQEVIWHPNRKFQLSEGMAFQHTAFSPNRLRFAWNDPNESGKEECAVIIPGKVLSALSAKEIYDLGTVINNAGLRCSRIDCAMDDYGKRIAPVLVMEALAKGNYSKFKTKDFRSKMLGDWTFYLGSRESARFTRFYNKDAQTKGKIPAHRWETSFKRDIAQNVFRGWLAIEEDEIQPVENNENLTEDYVETDWEQEENGKQLSWEKRSALYMVRSIIGSFNFIDRESKPNEKNLNRIPRLSWWQDFIDQLESGEGIYHTRAVPEPSLERVTNWMKRQVMRSLCCVFGALENDALSWFRARVEEARLTLQEKHMNLINQYKLEYQAYKDEVNFSGAG